MSLFDHLMESRTKEDLAKLAVATAKENAALRDRVGALEHELFWLKVDLRDNDFAAARPSPPREKHNG